MEDIQSEPFLKIAKKGCISLLLGITGLALIIIFIFMLFRPPEQVWLRTVLLASGILLFLVATLLGYVGKKELQQLGNSGGVVLPKHPVSMDRFSPQLRNLIQEVTVATGKQVKFYDNRKVDRISDTQQMTGLGVPPFHMSPDFSDGIKIYLMHHWLSKEHEEATLAHMLMRASLVFEGFPNARFNVPYASLPMDPQVSDANAIQKWLDNALKSYIAEKRIRERGFNRDEVLEQNVSSLEARNSYPLATSWGNRSFQAINSAVLLLQLENGMLRPEAGNRIRSHMATCENAYSGFNHDVETILKILHRHHITEPNGFLRAFKEILHLWNIGRYVTIGFLDKARGTIQDAE